MATASVTNTLVNATTVDAGPLNTNFSDLVSFLNGSIVHVDGSKAMTGDLAMGGNKVTGLAAPTASGDAARKDELDTKSDTSHTHTTSTISGLDAGDVTTGTFATARIPNLDASKITAGTLADARLSSNVAFTNAAETFASTVQATGFLISGDTILDKNGAYTRLREGGADVVSGNGATEIYLGGVANGSGNDLQISGSQVVQVVSSRRYKNIHGEVDKASLRAQLSELPVYTFTYKDSIDETEHIGWMAEDVAAVDPRLAEFNEDGEVESIRWRAVLALLA